MPSELDRNALVDFMTIIEDYLAKKITLIGAGGTAMTLLNLKSSTIDIDFTGPRKDINEFRRVEKSISHGYKIDTYYDGAVLTQMLPADYLDRSRQIKTGLKMIDLRALHPVDIVVTKLGRLNKRDEDDIAACIRKCEIGRKEVAERAEQVARSYPGNEVVYRDNLDHVLHELF